MRETAIQHFCARAFPTAQGSDKNVSVLHYFHAVQNDITGDVNQAEEPASELLQALHQPIREVMLSGNFLQANENFAMIIASGFSD